MPGTAAEQFLNKWFELSDYRNKDDKFFDDERLSFAEIENENSGINFLKVRSENQQEFNQELLELLEKEGSAKAHEAFDKERLLINKISSLSKIYSNYLDHLIKILDVEVAFCNLLKPENSEEVVKNGYRELLRLNGFDVCQDVISLIYTRQRSHGEYADLDTDLKAVEVLTFRYKKFKEELDKVFNLDENLDKTKRVIIYKDIYNRHLFNRDRDESLMEDFWFTFRINYDRYAFASSIELTCETVFNQLYADYEAYLAKQEELEKERVNSYKDELVYHIYCALILLQAHQAYSKTHKIDGIESLVPLIIASERMVKLPSCSISDLQYLDTYKKFVKIYSGENFIDKDLVNLLSLIVHNNYETLSKFSDEFLVESAADSIDKALQNNHAEVKLNLGYEVLNRFFSSTIDLDSWRKSIADKKAKREEFLSEVRQDSRSTNSEPWGGVSRRSRNINREEIVDGELESASIEYPNKFSDRDAESIHSEADEELGDVELDAQSTGYASRFSSEEEESIHSELEEEFNNDKLDALVSNISEEDCSSIKSEPVTKPRKPAPKRYGNDTIEELSSDAETDTRSDATFIEHDTDSESETYSYGERSDFAESDFEDFFGYTGSSDRFVPPPPYPHEDPLPPLWDNSYLSEQDYFPEVEDSEEVVPDRAVANNEPPAVSNSVQEPAAINPVASRQQAPVIRQNLSLPNRSYIPDLRRELVETVFLCNSLHWQKWITDVAKYQKLQQKKFEYIEHRCELAISSRDSGEFKIDPASLMKDYGSVWGPIMIFVVILSNIGYRNWHTSAPERQYINSDIKEVDAKMGSLRASIKSNLENAQKATVAEVANLNDSALVAKSKDLIENSRSSHVARLERSAASFVAATSSPAA